MNRACRFAHVVAVACVAVASLVACSGRVTVPFNSDVAGSSHQKLAQAAMERHRMALLLSHLAAAKSTAASPATIPTLAPFQGNLTVVPTVAANGVALQRQADCSLLFTNFEYNFTTSQLTATVDSQTPGYEKILHDAAGLTTTPDVFANGCTDSTLGLASDHTAFLGIGKSGQYIGDALDVGAIYVATMTGTNSFTFSTPAQLTPDLPAVSIMGADLNKDGNQDLISINNNGVDSSVSVFLGNGDGTFKPATNYEIPGVNANYGFINDMNGDGKLDFVVATGIQSTFQFLIYLGDGTGKFAAPVPFTPASSSLSFDSRFVSADVNGDNHVDIITSDGEVFLGQASGTNFTAGAQAFPPIAGSNELAPGMIVGDFNNDKKVDLATDDGTVIRTYLGKGDGTFSGGPAYSTISNRGLILGTDIDGDGNLDMLSGFFGPALYGGDDYLPNQAYALMGNGDGSFVGAPVLPIVYTGTNLADLNGDGRPDLVGLVTSPTQTSFVTYLTGANGVPVAGPTLPVTLNSGIGVDSFAVGAFNTNTNNDPGLIYLDNNPNGQSFYVSTGSGNGSFSGTTIIPAPSLVPAGNNDLGQNLSGLQLADFNHDGKLDIAYWFYDQASATQIYYEGFAVQLGNGDGTFGAPHITLTYQSASAPIQFPENELSGVQDVNNDNFPDVFMVVPSQVKGSIQPPTVQLFVGNGDGTFQAPNTLTLTPNILPVVPLGVQGSPFAFADLNGDGKLDLVTVGSSADGSIPQVAITLGNGDGTFQLPAILTFDGFGYPASAALGDFNGDGKLDLFIPGAGVNTGGVFLGNGNGTFQTTANSDGTVSATQLVALATTGAATATDLNGDKVPDVLVGNVVLINKSSAVVTPATTSTAISSSLNPSTVGATVTFTATVTSATAGTITGSVAFFDGATQIGAGTISAGVATFTNSTLAQGTHSITAQYGGDTNYAESTSPAVSQVVNAGGTASTTTALTSSLNPSKAGTSVTFMAAVTSATPGTISGSVSFYDGTKLLDTPITMTGNLANLTISNLAQGTHTITAQYNGNANYATSTSSAVSQVVNAAGTAATTTSLTSSLNPSTVGAAVAFTATVTSTTPGTISGSVSFFDGAKMLDTPITMTGNIATLTISNFAQGTHTITAQYNGNANYATSTSTAVMQVVNAGSTTATSTTLSASSTNAPSGTNITFSATVAASTSSSAPATARRLLAAQSAPAVTGTVTFFDGATQLGTGSVGTGGVATYQNSTLAVGAHSITAQYDGDTNYSASTSPAVQVTITAAGGSFTIGASPASVSVTKSTPATTNITVTPAGGFNQAVTFSCGTVTSFSCSFSPASVTPNGGVASTTLTISYNPGAARATQQASVFVGPMGINGASGSGTARLTRRVAFALGGELFVLGLLLTTRRKKFLAYGTGRFAYALVLCALAVTLMAGCGSNNSSPQSTTITVTASSGTQSATTIVDVSYKN
jgi:hypothetical protein